MANENNQVSLAPAVTQVIDQFIAALRADDGIQDDAIDRLEKVLRKGTVPKPDEINSALFDFLSGGEA